MAKTIHKILVDDLLFANFQFYSIEKFNEEPAMRNLIIDGAAGGETKRRHDVTFPLLTLHRGKDLCCTINITISLFD
jgi:hypothetical protein